MLRPQAVRSRGVHEVSGGGGLKRALLVAAVLLACALLARLVLVRDEGAQQSQQTREESINNKWGESRGQEMGEQHGKQYYVGALERNATGDAALEGHGVRDGKDPYAPAPAEEVETTTALPPSHALVPSGIARTDWKNIIYVKVVKCMSSTTAGVVRRMGYRAGINGIYDYADHAMRRGEPLLRANHLKRYALEPIIQSLEQPTFVFSTVREPGSRCVSRAYFRVRLGRRPPLTTEDKLKALRGCTNIVSKYLQISTTREESPEEIMSHYHFLGSAERADETFVLLYYMAAPSFGTQIYDVLSQDSKNSTAANAMAPGLRDMLKLRYTERTTQHVAFKDEPEVVRNYLQNEFPKHNQRDLKLLELVHARMDELIAQIPDFAERLEQFRSLMRKVKEACPTQEPPCFFQDMGCSQDCINRVCAANGDTRPLPVIRAWESPKA